MSTPLNSGNEPKGPMTPKGQTCDTRLGYKHGTISPDALGSRYGVNYGSQGIDPDGGDGRSQGLPEMPARSGRFNGTGPDLGE